MSRTSNTATRRAEIVAAMLPVLAQHGYEKATIQAIARQAGLAPGLIHYHFDSKQAILVALVEHIAAFAQARFAQVQVQGGGAAQRLRAYIDARVGQGSGASPELASAWVMIGAEAVRQAEVREVYQAALAAELQLLKALLDDCLRHEGRSTRGAATLAAGLMATMEGAFMLASAAGELMPSAYAARMTWQFAQLSVAAAPLAGRAPGRVGAVRG